MNSPIGFVLSKPARFLKVAIEMKKQTPQMTRVDKRRNCERMEFRGQ